MLEITLQYVQFFILPHPYCMLYRDSILIRQCCSCISEHWPKVMFQAHWPSKLWWRIHSPTVETFHLQYRQVFRFLWLLSVRLWFTGAHKWMLIDSLIGWWGAMQWLRATLADSYLWCFTVCSYRCCSILWCVCLHNCSHLVWPCRCWFPRSVRSLWLGSDDKHLESY